MNETEVKKLFLIINNTYSNFPVDDVKVTVWADLLKDVKFELAQRNLRKYVMDPANKYPPHPGELSRVTVHEAQGPYIPNAEETRAMLDKQERLLQNREALPIPQCALELKERLKRVGGS